MKWLLGLYAAVLAAVNLFPLGALAAVFLGGVVFWGGFNWSLELTNTESFCISCHEMRDYVYREYKTTIHYGNRTGVRASCPDCHVPREWVHKVARKVRATNELFHWIAGSIDTPEKFAVKRLSLARQVWASMQATDSRECRNCHGIDFMRPEAQAAMAGRMHDLAWRWNMTCIDCHKGIAHSLPKGFDKEAMLDELHERMEKEKLDCRQCHTDMAAPAADQDWD